MDYNYKKSDRSYRNEKVKSKDNKYYGSQKHIRILMEKQNKSVRIKSIFNGK